jgi:pimeloyl-ACP methyl ester carboxylesterase
MRIGRYRRPFALTGAVACFLPVFCAGCADRLLLYPTTHPIDAVGAERRTFEHGGRTVEVFTARSPGVGAGSAPQAYVLEFCGNAARAESVASYVARQWGRRPVEVWVMNYPGYGGSDGPPTLRSIPDVALAAYDDLARCAGGRPILVSGRSLGTSVALHVGARRPTAGMVLQSPPPIQRQILQHHGWWNLWLIAIPVALQVPSEMNSLSSGARVNAPALFVLSGRDSVVPIEYQRMVVDAYGGEKEVLLMESADHNTPFTGADGTLLQGGLDWLWARVVMPTSVR